MSFLISGSSNLRPIRRFVAYNVFCEFVTACRLAGIPVSRSPSAVNATTEGVVRAPSEFSRTYNKSDNTRAYSHQTSLPVLQYKFKRQWQPVTVDARCEHVPYRSYHFLVIISESVQPHQ